MIWLNGMSKDLSIIILSYKQQGLVKQSLRGLRSLNIPLDHEIIVVDNNSQDGLAEMVKNEFMEVKLIEAGENRGYAAGNNLGIKKAQGKYILILNPDVTILSDAITKLFDFLEQNPRAGIVGPQIKNPDGSIQYSCSRFPDWRLPFFRRTFLSDTKKGRQWNSNYLMMDWDHRQNRQVDWLFGACLMVRQEAIDQVGLLDEGYFLYMEDLDWCRRFWEKNWQVWYLAETEVIHFHQRMSAEGSLLSSFFSKTARIHFTSWLRYYFKFKNRKLLR